jgi:hypothetical protein
MEKEEVLSELAVLVAVSLCQAAVTEHFTTNVSYSGRKMCSRTYMHLKRIFETSWAFDHFYFYKKHFVEHAERQQEAVLDEITKGDVHCISENTVKEHLSNLTRRQNFFCFFFENSEGCEF